MKKYNLSKMMTRAWELVKHFGFVISAGLRKAWKEAKSMLTVANTYEERTKLRNAGYGYTVSHLSAYDLIVVSLNNVTVGTEKQIAYAKSLIVDKLNKVNETASLMMSNGKMDKATYLAGMESLVKELESYSDAKFIIERVK